VNSVVLLDAVCVVPSGAQSSCYQVHALPASCCLNAGFGTRNFANEKYFVLLLTPVQILLSVDNPRDQRRSQS
jgi:hypothetical protein